MVWPPHQHPRSEPQRLPPDVWVGKVGSPDSPGGHLGAVRGGLAGGSLLPTLVCTFPRRLLKRLVYRFHSTNGTNDADICPKSCRRTCRKGSESLWRHQSSVRRRAHICLQSCHVSGMLKIPVFVLYRSCLPTVSPGRCLTLTFSVT